MSANKQIEILIALFLCSENMMISRGTFDWLPSFAAVRINKRHNDTSVVSYGRVHFAWFLCVFF